MTDENAVVADQYADGTYAWWHLSRPSPELVAAVSDGWLPARGRVLDVGCGLGREAGHLAAAGWQAVGIDLSAVAVTRATAGTATGGGPSSGTSSGTSFGTSSGASDNGDDGDGHGSAAFLCADARQLPFRGHRFDAALDRGCFHYLTPPGRLRYASELRRVLRPGGKLLLRASLHVAGARNDITEGVIRAAFAAWQVEHLERAVIPSDTRMLEVIIARLSVPL